LDSQFCSVSSDVSFSNIAELKMSTVVCTRGLYAGGLRVGGSVWLSYNRQWQHATPLLLAMAARLCCRHRQRESTKTAIDPLNSQDVGADAWVCECGSIEFFAKN